MALFRSRTPATTKPTPQVDKLPLEKIEAAKPVPTKTNAKPTSGGSSGGGGGEGFLKELGVYTLPNELKADFRKVREEVQRYLVDENASQNIPTNK